MKFEDAIKKSIRGFIEGKVPRNIAEMSEEGLMYTPEYMDKLEEAMMAKPETADPTEEEMLDAEAQ